MPVRWKKIPEQYARRLTKMVRDNWEKDLTNAGKAGADAIIETTLKGIGANDVQFVPYSVSYTRFLQRTKAKAVSPVNLRGVLYAGGKTNRKGSRLRTPRGVYDKDSEMSLDLLTISARPTSVTIKYTPRKSKHMLIHNTGDGRMPKREWFSMNKTEVKAAIMLELRAAWHDRVEKMNRGQ